MINHESHCQQTCAATLLFLILSATAAGAQVPITSTPQQEYDRLKRQGEYEKAGRLLRENPRAIENTGKEAVILAEFLEKRGWEMANDLYQFATPYINGFELNQRLRAGLSRCCFSGFVFESCAIWSSRYTKYSDTEKKAFAYAIQEGFRPYLENPFREKYPTDWATLTDDAGLRNYQEIRNSTEAFLDYWETHRSYTTLDDWKKGKKLLDSIADAALGETGRQELARYRRRIDLHVAWLDAEASYGNRQWAKALPDYRRVEALVQSGLEAPLGASGHLKERIRKCVCEVAFSREIESARSLLARSAPAALAALTESQDCMKTLEHNEQEKITFYQTIVAAHTQWSKGEWGSALSGYAQFVRRGDYEARGYDIWDKYRQSAEGVVSELAGKCEELRELGTKVRTDRLSARTDRESWKQLESKIYAAAGRCYLGKNDLVAAGDVLDDSEILNTEDVDEVRRFLHRCLSARNMLAALNSTIEDTTRAPTTANIGAALLELDRISTDLALNSSLGCRTQPLNSAEIKAKLLTAYWSSYFIETTEALGQFKSWPEFDMELKRAARLETIRNNPAAEYGDSAAFQYLGTEALKSVKEALSDRLLEAHNKILKKLSDVANDLVVAATDRLRANEWPRQELERTLDVYSKTGSLPFLSEESRLDVDQKQQILRRMIASDFQECTGFSNLCNALEEYRDWKEKQARQELERQQELTRQDELSRQRELARQAEAKKDEDLGAAKSPVTAGIEVLPECGSNPILRTTFESLLTSPYKSSQKERIQTANVSKDVALHATPPGCRNELLLLRAEYLFKIGRFHDANIAYSDVVKLNRTAADNLKDICRRIEQNIVAMKPIINSMFSGSLRRWERNLKDIFELCNFDKSEHSVVTTSRPWLIIVYLYHKEMSSSDGDMTHIEWERDRMTSQQIASVGKLVSGMAARRDYGTRAFSSSRFTEVVETLDGSMSSDYRASLEAFLEMLVSKPPGEILITETEIGQMLGIMGVEVQFLHSLIPTSR